MNLLSPIAAQFEISLQSLIDELPIYGELKESVRYALSGGGKRIRPLLSLAMISDLSAEIPSFAFSAAAALEFVHSASLAHDDLPALDDDDTRRGRPSLHRAFSEATALLCGDYLVPAAFEILTSKIVPSSMRGDLCASLARAYAEVCFGQQLDLSAVESRDEILRIHSHKTAALFRCAGELAGILSVAEARTAQQLSEVGKLTGSYFQLVDDFLDREDTGTNFFSEIPLSQALSELDQAFTNIEEKLTLIEANQKALRHTREVIVIIQSQLDQ